jgi:small subunit ribosomal protein S1
MNENKSWQENASFYEVGRQVSARVSKILSYGCMLELDEGLEAFMHRQDMAWMTRNIEVKELVTCGDVVEVQVLEVLPEKEFIKLGMKQCGENPWKGSEARYPEGMRVKGVVTDIVDYGCFLTIDEKLEAILLVSEMHWLDKNLHPSKWISLGDCLEVMVLDVNEKRYRMSVGWKQCQPNPWEQFAQKYQPKEVLSGRVDSVSSLVTFVELDFGVCGHLFQSDVPDSFDLQKGDDVNVRIVSIDAERERINLDLVLGGK